MSSELLEFKKHEAFAAAFRVVLRTLCFFITVFITGCAKVVISKNQGLKSPDPVKSGLAIENGSVKFSGAYKTTPNTPISAKLITRNKSEICDQAEQVTKSDTAGDVSLNIEAQLKTCDQIELLISTGKAAAKSVVLQDNISETSKEVWLAEVKLIPISVSCKGEFCSSEVKLQGIVSTNSPKTTVKLLLQAKFFDGRDGAELFAREVEEVVQFNDSGIAVIEITEEIPVDVSIFNVEAELELKSYEFIGENHAN